MERGNRILTVYRWCVIFLGAAFLALVGSSQGRGSLAVFLFFCALAAGTELARVPNGTASFSLGSGVVLAALLCQGVPAALGVAAAGHLVADLLSRRLSLASVFNAAQAVLAVLAAAVPYHFLRGSVGGSSLAFVVPQAVFLTSYFLANNILIGLALALEHGLTALAENRLLVGWDFLGTLLSLPTGMFLAQVHQLLGFTALALAAVPLLTLSYIWQLYARVRAANEEVVALYAATSNVGTSIDLDTTLHEILVQTRRLVRYDRGLVYLADEENLVPAASEGPVPDLARYRAVPLGEGLVGQAALTRHPESAAAGGSGENAGKTWHCLALPLLVGERLVGVLDLEREKPAFTPHELQLLAILGGQAAGALENARLYSEVAALARLDALTGVYNRRALVEALTAEVARCERYNQRLSVLMVDLDNFKTVNDACGHLTGDAVLKRITGAIASSVRNVDVVGRYGGDEVAVVLPGAGPLEAYQVAERI
ncbi:MAG TPA: sensor domain-containing diguanylate cyclase, partial [Firmicutes bacterium]|nr:sensor domain-containing diguanylate cyclase [Bacillota bacterium]